MPSNTQRQVVGVTGAISHDQKVLLMKRSLEEDFLPGYWEMPGGKVEFGEIPEQALIREIKEETNLDIAVDTPFSLFSYVVAEKQTQVFDIQFICMLKSDPSDVRMSNEHSEAKWFAKEDVAQLKISDKMRESIQKVFNQIKLDYETNN